MVALITRRAERTFTIGRSIGAAKPRVDNLLCGRTRNSSQEFRDYSYSGGGGRRVEFVRAFNNSAGETSLSGFKPRRESNCRAFRNCRAYYYHEPIRYIAQVSGQMYYINRSCEYSMYVDITRFRTDCSFRRCVDRHRRSTRKMLKSVD